MNEAAKCPERAGVSRSRSSAERLREVRTFPGEHFSLLWHNAQNGLILTVERMAKPIVIIPTQIHDIAM